MAKPSPQLSGKSDPVSQGQGGWRRRLEWLLAAVGVAVVGWKLLQPRPSTPSAPATPEPTPHPPEVEEIHYPDGRIEHPKVRRETRDVRFGLILGILIGLACLFVIHIVVIWWYFWWVAGAQAERKTSPYPLAPKLSTKLPPSPRLEQIQYLAGDTSGFVSEQIAAQEKVLHAYGPTDEKDFVHIPIEQAMQLVAPHLSVRKDESSAAHDQGLLDWGESNSGRVFRGGQR